MKYLFFTISIFFSISSIAQEETKKWVKKNNNGVIVQTGFYKNKKREGEWNFFYDDGMPSLKVTYKRGVLNGKSYRYDLQGNIIAELYYKDGELTGNQIYFYQTGQKLSEGKMINGKEEGAWKYYSQNGDFMGYVKYKNGKQINELSK